MDPRLDMQKKHRSSSHGQERQQVNVRVASYSDELAMFLRLTAVVGGAVAAVALVLAMAN
ncbi:MULTISPECIES: hypothetical protein [unclassified Sinorhizobium]|uniref:hypothetical protein n=1 Tax=unclassified Sinorhizobium TaxID=2613772 RepID=UPI0024C2867E|nr:MULTISPECIES: hypothetical protein [unclassified Sinorhizobium]MDK1377806.1 hypothetical protein [Sinorhizobium sp. 6-70]MDK1480148.1 hypothetical protein [Sinorhizobium sp. 6-117]